MFCVNVYVCVFLCVCVCGDCVSVFVRACMHVCWLCVFMCLCVCVGGGERGIVCVLVFGGKDIAGKHRKKEAVTKTNERESKGKTR